MHTQRPGRRVRRKCDSAGYMCKRYVLGWHPHSGVHVFAAPGVANTATLDNTASSANMLTPGLAATLPVGYRPTASAYPHTRPHTHPHTHTHVPTHAHSRTHTHTHPHTSPHSHTLAHTPTPTHTHQPTLTFTSHLSLLGNTPLSPSPAFRLVTAVQNSIQRGW